MRVELVFPFIGHVLSLSLDLRFILLFGLGHVRLLGIKEDPILGPWMSEAIGEKSVAVFHYLIMDVSGDQSSNYHDESIAHLNTEQIA
jgi:hypothetical protein